MNRIQNMLLAQITDLHIKRQGRLVYDRVDTARHLEAAVAQIAALSPRPDLVVATGDLTDAGHAEEYELLRHLLAPLPMPLLVLPGNHDARDALRAAFAGEGYLPRSGFLRFVVEDWPLRLVALDTVVEGIHSGLLCAERLGWLDETLAAAPDRPTLILMHHPPFRTGIAQTDAVGLAGIEDLAAIVARHPQVERLLCGHVHRSIHMRFAGTIASTAPSTAHQLPLDLSPDGPETFVMEPPGYQLHLWDETAGLVSHTATVGDFAGPYPYLSEAVSA
jgi:3',5'-cyclic AMP phosphodiesterase CpdA